MVQRKTTPPPYRGTQSPGEFITEMGNVWIGLIETVASDADQNIALAGYFGVEPKVIHDWIEARGCAAIRSCASNGMGAIATSAGSNMRSDMLDIV